MEQKRRKRRKKSAVDICPREPKISVEKICFYSKPKRQRNSAVRILGLARNKHLARKTIALAMASSLFVGAFLFYAPVTQGAMYTYFQTSWAGNADTNAPFPVHGTNQTGWTKYYSKDAGVTAGTELTLTATANSATQTSSTDFNAGTLSSTSVSGTGDSADVVLELADGDGSLVTAFDSDGVVVSDPSSGNDFIDAMAIDSSYVYLVGRQNSGVWRIEKRNITTGALETAFDTDGIVTSDPTGSNDKAAAVAVDASYIYVAGYQATGGDCSTGSDCWRIEKRNITTGALETAFDTDGIVTSDPTSGSDVITSIAIDSSYIYLGGHNTSTRWRIEKRNITTGALETAFDTDGILDYEPSGFTARLYDIAIDSSFIYLGGYQYDEGGCSSNDCWRIEKRNIATGALVTAFDTDGIIKNNPSTDSDYVTQLSVDADYLYAAGVQGASCAISMSCWRIEKRNITTGALVTSFDTDGVATSDPSDWTDQLWAMALDSSFVYVGGHKANSCSSGGFCWYVEKRTNSVYAATGTITSSAIDTTANIEFTTISWTETLPANTDITIQLAHSTDNSTWSDYLGPDGTTGTSFTTSSGENIASAFDGKRYIKYKATFTTSDTSATSTLSDITIAYTAYSSSATLTSSPYDSSSSGNVLSSIAWTETISAGTTDVKFQLRTSADNTTWSSWAGPNGTDSDYFTNPAGGEAMPSAFTSGSNDRWLQYKVWLTTTDGDTTPTLSDITITYVVNATPDFDATYGNSGVSASQGSDGTVTINFKVRDTDSTSGTVTPTFKYSTDGGSSFNTITSGLSSGATDAKAVETSAYTLHTVTWTPSSQGAIGTSTYEEDFQVQVVVNDGELANAEASQASANFTMDTTPPASGAVDIDSTTNQLTISVTDSSAVAMKISNDSDLSSDGSNDDSGSWIAYGTDANSDGFGDTPLAASVTKSWTLTGSDPETVYIQFKDAKGNTTSAISSTTPRKPSNIIYQDISNTGTSEWKIFIAWGIITAPTPGFANYKVYISTDGSTYSLESTITERNTNYYIDTELSTGTTYYYKVRSEDSNGNISEWSSVVSDNPDGQGGSDLTSPAVTAVTVYDTQTTSATITWTTDELSNSTVGYSTDSSYSTETGVSSMVTSHSVTITGLSANTAYNFRVKSTDPSGNISSWATSSPFTTDAGPAISNVSSTSVTNITATIAWVTDIASDSTVIYSTNSNLSSSQQTNSSSLVASHSVSLSGLTQGTVYYYSVRSTDASSNIANDTNGGSYYTFTTTTDSTGPTISGISATAATNSVTIIWTTNELATSQVEYGATSAYGTTTTQDSSLTIQHAVVISSLFEGTTYNFRVISQDANSNSTTGSNNTFTTSESAELDPTPATAPVISSVTAAVVSETSATITWTTNENSTSQVFYGRTTAYGSQTTQDSTLTVQHSVTLTGLTRADMYYFKVRSLDSSNNAAENDNSGQSYSFTTLQERSGGGAGGGSNTVITVEKIIERVVEKKPALEEMVKIVQQDATDKAQEIRELSTTEFFDSLVKRTQENDKGDVFRHLTAALNEI
ncbi:MAG: fibronectin type III domain-containing protein, partial [Candidatus Wildermuthbacteria bacterium]|nr:fibronectin type III domain-containing protein [Candidatus Wildermuthbacteria bacterium]